MTPRTFDEWWKQNKRMVKANLPNLTVVEREAVMDWLRKCWHDSKDAAKELYSHDEDD